MFNLNQEEIKYLILLGLTEKKDVIEVKNNDKDTILFEIDCELIGRIDLKITKEKKVNYFVTFLNFFSKFGLTDNPSNSTIYQLIFKLKDGKKKYTYLNDFDVLRTKKILDKLNNSFGEVL